MRKLLIAGVLLFMAVSCNEKVQEQSTEDPSGYELSTEKWPNKRNVNSEVEAILNEWPEYIAMEVSFDAIYNAVNREDLSLTVENIIEEQKLLEASSYPKEFDKPQIKSRQKVFKTYVLKVKGDLIYRLDPEKSVIEMIDAYNAQRKQFSIVLNNVLDTKLILEEE
ncbi:hypothetical protein [Maribacter sp. HTCC2170]|uniref:hypothetical protein n=1 Tax=Maribacter sp. (strain HTCC2170 / KCCM 42371) TaxID=313603 RepID=UPI00006BD385|nr:hypothetical protein [Maribacter sp. HTCC2170]EAR02506.1 hypothetical protein FB2170_04445 [Maribacter sp. HTCC2170]